MKSAPPLLLFCLVLFSSISSAHATYKYEQGIKFYIVGSKDKVASNTTHKATQPRPVKHRFKTQRNDNNPLSNLLKHTFVHLVPVWGGTKCGSRWTEVIVPDAFTSPLGNVNFSRACARHDDCYEQQKGKAFCDRQIRSNLKRECRRAFRGKSNHLRGECLSYTALYYNTIVQFGDIGYSSVKTAKRVGRYAFHQSRHAAQWITGRKRHQFKR